MATSKLRDIDQRTGFEQRTGPAVGIWLKRDTVHKTPVWSQIAFYLLALALFVGLFIGLGALGLWLSAESGERALIWPPAALTFLMFWYGQGRLLPGIVLGWAALVALYDLHGLEIGNLAVSQTLGSFLSVYWLRRFGFQGRFTRLTDLLDLLFYSALLAGTVAAITRAFGYLLVSPELSVPAIVHHSLQYWLGDSLAVLLIVPVVLTWHAKPKIESAIIPFVLELLLLLGMIVAALWLNFRPGIPGVIPNPLALYILVPTTIWAGIRFGPRGASLYALAVGLFLFWAATQRLGPLFAYEPGVRALFNAAFIAAISFTALGVSAIAAERKLLERAYEDSEGRFRALATGSGAGLAVLDNGGVIRQVDSKFCELAGLSNRDLIDSPLAAFLPGQSSLKDRPLDGGESNKSHGKSVRLVPHSVQAIQDVDGKSVGSLVILSDDVVTQSAQRQVNRFRKLFDEAYNEIYVFETAGGQLVEANKTAMHKLGYLGAETEKLSISRLAPQFTGEAFKAFVHSVRSGAVGEQFETDIYRKDGSSYLVEAKCLLEVDNAQEYLIVIAHDISLRRQLKAESGDRCRLLDDLVSDKDLDAVLKNIVSSLKSSDIGGASALFLADSCATKLELVAVSGLPLTLQRRLIDTKVGPVCGSDGLAAHSRECVIADDVRTHASYAGLADEMLELEMRASWSCPVITRKGALLGVLSLYFQKPRMPASGEIEMLKSAAAMAALAIQFKSAEQRADGSDLLLQDYRNQLVQLANSALLADHSVELALGIGKPLATVVQLARACLGMVRPGDERGSRFAEALEKLEQQSRIARDAVQGFEKMLNQDMGCVEEMDLVLATQSAVGRVRSECETLAISVDVEAEELAVLVQANSAHLDRLLAVLLREGVDSLACSDAAERTMHVQISQGLSGLSQVDIDLLGTTTRPSHDAKVRMQSLAACRCFAQRFGGDCWIFEDEGRLKKLSFNLAGVGERKSATAESDQESNPEIIGHSRLA